jgi:hypothetical protein
MQYCKIQMIISFSIAFLKNIAKCPKKLFNNSYNIIFEPITFQDKEFLHQHFATDLLDMHFV